MRRGLTITLSVGAVVIVLLCVALATVGAQLDNVTIERNRLRSQGDSRQEIVDGLSKEMDTLKATTLNRQETIGRLQDDFELSLNTIEQLKSELVRVKSQAAKDIVTANP